MGSQSVKAITTLEDRKVFVQHVLNDIDALEYMLNNNLFEKNVQRVGAEQELCIVDEHFRPAFTAIKILEKINDPHYTTELALFNLEINLDPFVLEKNCFSRIEKQLRTLIDKGKKVAELEENSRILLTGILPTLRKKDLVFDNVTPFKRYKTINDVIKKIRGKDFKLHIQGVDELILKHKSILFEACNTSFQVHLQINPDKAIDMYNWSQAIAGPILSVMTNSPLLLGKELWSETRVALFQQSIDLRNVSHFSREQKPRVSFGNDWIKESILELFTDDISRYPPIVTSNFEEDSLEMAKNGIMPKLKAINLHNGTLYKWNRLCYGVANNVAHLRIENRYIPSGPSIKDEIANAMFWVGVMQGMPKQYEKIWKKMSFKDAKANFINACRTGLNTYFNWFGKGMSAKKLLEYILIPIAREGLLQSNVNRKEIDYYLGIIQKRIDNGNTGSKWIIENKRELSKYYSKYETNAILTKHIYQNQNSGKVISQWKSIKRKENTIDKKYDKLYKIMTTKLFVIHKNDLIHLANKIMEWKKIHHLPVVDDKNKIIGIIAKKDIQHLILDNELSKTAIVEDLMTTNFVSADPETSFINAKKLISQDNNTCIAVLDKNNSLIGLVTNNDIKKIEQIAKAT